MTITARLVSLLSKATKINLAQFRNYATTISKRELEVPTFCDIYVDLPYPVHVKPLNVHKYHNLDKLIIQIDERFEQFLEHDINGNRVEIFNKSKNACLDIPDNVFCSVKAPIKANLYVKSKKDIIVGYFNGDKLHLKSSEGNIIVDKFQGNSVKLKTYKGNINLKEFIQASTIIAEIVENGSIISGRLQGLDLKLKTKTGNISVESSYSTKSQFEVDSGNFELHNIHKSCQILLKDGTVNLTGFDGNLKTLIENGSADIQLSRITHDSEISVLNGALNLKLGDCCQDYVVFKIQAKDCDVAENVKSTVDRLDELLVLTPDINDENTVLINCLNGIVNVESASWQDMIKARLKK